MSKQDAKKLMEKLLGPQGLKMASILGKDFSELDKTVASGNQNYTMPEAWDSQVGINLINHLQSDKSSSLNLIEVISSHVNSLRWWGESYGYFNRKSDSATFAKEYLALIHSQVFLPGVKVWNAALPGYSPGEGWFVDPETSEAKPTQTNARPQVLEYLSTLPAIRISDSLSLPISSSVSVGILDWKNFDILDDQEKFHALRLITDALNIILLMTSFPDQRSAASTQEAYPILLFLHNAPAQERQVIELGIRAASAELAQIQKRSIPELEFPYSQSDITELTSTLSKASHKYIGYFEMLFKESGSFNNILIADGLEDYELGHLWSDIEISPPKQEPQEAPTETLLEDKEVLIEQTSMGIEAPSIDIPISKVTIKQEPSVIASQELPPELEASAQKSITHQFQMGKSTGFLTVTVDSLGIAQGLNISASKVDPIVSSYLATCSDFSTVLLSRGANMNKIVEVLEGTVFSPNSDNYDSILDYCAKWLKNYWPQLR